MKLPIQTFHSHRTLPALNVSPTKRYQRIPGGPITYIEVLLGWEALWVSVDDVREDDGRRLNLSMVEEQWDEVTR